MATIFEPKGFTHPHSGIDYVGKYVFANPKKVLAQPDFYKEGLVVFDAKYKPHKTLFDKKQREDRFQLLAYMYVFNVNISGLIVPVSLGDDSFMEGDINGRGGKMLLVGMNVDQQCASFSDYIAIMETEEMRLLESIRGFVS